MQIFVYKLSGNERAALEVNPDGTLADLRKAVHDSELVSMCDTFSLVFGEEALENCWDFRTLAELGIKTNSTLGHFYI